MRIERGQEIESLSVAFQQGANRLTEISDGFRSHVSEVLKKEYNFRKYVYLGAGCTACVVNPIGTPLAVRISQRWNDRPKIGEVLQSIEDITVQSSDSHESLRIELLPKGIMNATNKDVRALFTSARNKGYFWGAPNTSNAVRLPETGNIYIADVDEMVPHETEDDFKFLSNLPVLKHISRFADKMERSINMLLEGCSPSSAWKLEDQLLSEAYSWYKPRNK